MVNRSSTQKHVRRAEIVVLTADGVGTTGIMRRTGKARTCVWRWQERRWRGGTRQRRAGLRRVTQKVAHQRALLGQREARLLVDPAAVPLAGDLHELEPRIGFVRGHHARPQLAVDQRLQAGVGVRAQEAEDRVRQAHFALRPHRDPAVVEVGRGDQ